MATTEKTERLYTAMSGTNRVHGCRAVRHTILRNWDLRERLTLRKVIPFQATHVGIACPVSVLEMVGLSAALSPSECSSG